MEEANLVRFDFFDETGSQPEYPILTLGEMLPDVSFPSGVLPTHTERWQVLFDDDSGDVRLTTDYKTLLLRPRTPPA